MYTKLTLEISPSAETDFREIWQKIAKFGHREASKTIQKIAYKIYTLEYLAYQYPEVLESGLFGLPYRQLDCENYQILFQVDKNHVQVLRII